MGKARNAYLQLTLVKKIRAEVCLLLNQKKRIQRLRYEEKKLTTQKVKYDETQLSLF